MSVNCRVQFDADSNENRYQSGLDSLYHQHWANQEVGVVGLDSSLHCVACLKAHCVKNPNKNYLFAKIICNLYCCRRQLDLRLEF